MANNGHNGKGNQLVPEILQDAFTISLGATFKGFELMINPAKTAGRMMDEMRTLMTIPEDAGDGLQDKARAVASVWLERGVSWVQEIKSAGEKFTKD